MLHTHIQAHICIYHIYMHAYTRIYTSTNINTSCIKIISMLSCKMFRFISQNDFTYHDKSTSKNLNTIAVSNDALIIKNTVDSHLLKNKTWKKRIRILYRSLGPSFKEHFECASKASCHNESSEYSVKLTLFTTQRVAEQP